MATTRHGNYGGPRFPYGSFSGKTEAAPSVSPTVATISPLYADEADAILDPVLARIANAFYESGQPVIGDQMLLFLESLESGDNNITAKIKQNLGITALENKSDLPAMPGTCQGRIGGSSIDPTAETGTVIWFTPYLGNSISLYNVDSSTWKARTFDTVQCAVPSGNGVHDVVAYWNGTQIKLQTVAWASTTARAESLAFQDGVYVISGRPYKRYLGSIYVASGTWSLTWNFQHRLEIKDTNFLPLSPPPYSHIYTTAVFRKYANESNGVPVLIPIAGIEILASAYAISVNGTAAVIRGISIGTDGVAKSSDGRTIYGSAGSNESLPLSLSCKFSESIGYHTIDLMEYSVATGGTTWGNETGPAVDAFLSVTREY